MAIEISLAKFLKDLFHLIKLDLDAKDLLEDEWTIMTQERKLLTQDLTLSE